jgi:hypothetical protein
VASDIDFATDRGRAGYDANRRDFNRLIWKANSPTWAFSDAEFDRAAASFDNPDHVSIVIHDYRWRLGLADGEPRYAELERRLALGPVIAAPTITLDGDSDGVRKRRGRSPTPSLTWPVIGERHGRSATRAGRAGHGAQR